MSAAQLSEAFNITPCTPEVIQVCRSLQLKSDELHAHCRLRILPEEFPAAVGFDLFEGSSPQDLVKRKVTGKPAFVQNLSGSQLALASDNYVQELRAQYPDEHHYHFEYCGLFINHLWPEFACQLNVTDAPAQEQQRIVVLACWTNPGELPKQLSPKMKLRALVTLALAGSTVFSSGVQAKAHVCYFQPGGGGSAVFPVSLTEADQREWTRKYAPKARLFHRQTLVPALQPVLLPDWQEVVAQAAHSPLEGRCEWRTWDRLGYILCW